MEKVLLKQDILHFSGKYPYGKKKRKVTKTDIINYAGATLGNASKSVLEGKKRAKRPTVDNMLDSILEMRREKEIETLLHNQQLRDGLMTYEFPDLSLPSQVLLPLDFGPPPPAGWFEPTPDSIYEHIGTTFQTNLPPPPIRDIDDTLVLLEMLDRGQLEINLNQKNLLNLPIRLN